MKKKSDATELEYEYLQLPTKEKYKEDLENDCNTQMNNTDNTK